MGSAADEQIALESFMMGKGAPPIFGFIHVATCGRWREVLNEQIELIRSSGLYQKTTRLFIGIVGPECHSYCPDDPKIEVIHRSIDLDEFEFPTLRTLHDLCRNTDGRVYYIHSKGVCNDTPKTQDWRKLMEYFVVERHDECLSLLDGYDVCGSNWHESPWPHFSGNFWWARSSYVAALGPIESLPPPVSGRDHTRRHQCERWIGSGDHIRVASLFQSHAHHYLSRYPREYYAGPEGPQYVEFPSRFGAVTSHGAPRIALIFDNVVRPDTTGIYCVRALRKVARVAHYLPAEIAIIPERLFDLFLFIDDGLEHDWPRRLRPSALWAIDTHLNPARLVRQGRAMDMVFAAQRDGVELLKAHGVNCLGWLPLACDPEVHRKFDVEKTTDVCFIANISTGQRRELVRVLQQHFPSNFVGQRFFEEMAETYSKSRVVINQSIRSDVNMRVFEAAACGSLLLTDDLSGSGLGSLFRPGEHLVTYRDHQELVEKAEFYLKHEKDRERIAAAGRDEALARHTYLHRMMTLINVANQHMCSETDPAEAAGSSDCAFPKTSIIIPTFNQLSFTKQCLESIRRNTTAPYEIVVVDNGSSDGTTDFLRQCGDVKVISNDANRGFAAAVNQGIAATSTGQLVVLNNDTLATPGWLESMLRIFDEEPGTGIVGPCSNNVPGPQRLADCPKEIATLDRFAEENRKINFGVGDDALVLVGFCMLIRRSVIETVGGFDEAFGLGTYEDFEFCCRAARAGFRLRIARDSYIYHFGSVSLHAAGIDVEALLRKNHELFKQRCTEALPVAEPVGMTSIVIVTHNALRFTRLCIESIRRCTGLAVELIVVDNGSCDGTVDYLSSQKDVRLICNEANAGFPAAANQGIGVAVGKYIVLLNNDVIVTPGWLKRLVRAVESSPNSGLAGPCSNEVSGEQRIGVDYNTIDGIDSFAQHIAHRNAGKVKPVDRLVGFCLLMRREVVERVGLLDERFGPGNFEDDDLCRRAKLAGYSAVIALDCFVHHFGSVTFTESGADYKAIMCRNRQKFEDKWRPESPSVESADPQSTVEPEPLLSAPCPPGPPGNPGICPSLDQIEVSNPTLSLCLIARDSSSTLAACLKSIRPWVDEMIVVDTGSKDDTPALARSLGARVCHFPWCDDFSAARNESLRRAAGRWLFWMDSDDTIDEQNGQKLRQLVQGPTSDSTLGFVLQVHCPPPRGEPYGTDTVVDHVKVIRNRPEIRFSGRIHEQILPGIRRLGGEVEWTDIFVSHSGSDQSAEGRARKQQRDLRLLHLELADDPDGTFPLFNLGMTLLDMGHSAEALGPLCRSLQTANPGDSHLRKVYALLVQAYSQLGRHGTALRTCLQGLTLYPEDPELLFRRGVLQQCAGDLDEAQRAFQMITEAKHTRHFSSVDRGILGVKAWHNLAIIHEHRRRFDLAADAWQRVTDLNPANRVAWLSMVNALSAQESIEPLEGLLNEQNRAVPEDIRAIALARSYARRGDGARGVAMLEEAYSALSSPDLLAELCELSFKCNCLETALRSLSLLVSLNPADASAMYNLGLVHLRLGEYAQAARCAEGSLELRANHAPSQAILKQAKALLGQNVVTQPGASRANTLRQFSPPPHTEAIEGVYIGPSLIGDALTMEPAIRALSMRRGSPVSLVLDGPVRSLFADNPHVTLCDRPVAECGSSWPRLLPSVAFMEAVAVERHISTGYFAQLGLDVGGADLRPRLHAPQLTKGSRPPRGRRNGHIALSPFSASCLVHRTGVPNKTMPVNWWNALIPQLPLPADSFGAAGEAELEGCRNFRGLTLLEVATMLRDYELLVVGDCGLAVVASTMDCDLVFLKSALPVWLTGPQTDGRLEIVDSPPPPKWLHSEVVAAVARMLEQ